MARPRYSGILAVTATVATGAMMWSLFAQSGDGAEAGTTKTCYPAKYTASGELILPENFYPLLDK